MANMHKYTTHDVINNEQELCKVLSNVCLSVADDEPGLVTLKSEEHNQKKTYKLNSIPITSFIQRNLCEQPRDELYEQDIYSKGEELIYYSDLKLYHVRNMDYRFAIPVKSMNMICTPIDHLVRFEAWTNKVDEWVSTENLLPMYGNKMFDLKETTEHETKPLYDIEYYRMMTISMNKIHRMGPKLNKQKMIHFMNRMMVLNKSHTTPKLNSEMDQSSSSKDL